MIKSQFAFAQADNKDWYGDLTHMEPGKGYRLFLKNASKKGFVYPGAIGKYASHGGSADAILRVAGPGWSVNPMAYQRSMTVTAVVQIDGAEFRDPDGVIGAFVDGECRGIAQLMPVEAVDLYEAFLMIHSNRASGETLVFKVFDADSEEVLQVAETMTFEADASHGTIAEPVVFSAGAVTPASEAEALPATFSLSQNHPNPFNAYTSIGYALPQASDVLLTIYAITGQEVAILVNAHQEAGRHRAVFDGSGYATGIYLYRLEAGSFVETKRMVLLK